MRCNQKIKTSTNYSPTDSNFDSKQAQINSNLDSKDQKPTIILGSETFGEIALPPTLSESFEVVDSSEIAQSIPMDKAQNKKDGKIKMTRTKILNPNSITPDKIKQNQLEADKKRNDALEHNQKFPQFYSPETQKAMGSSSENNQNLIQSSLGKIGAIFGSVNADARGLSNPSQGLLIYNRSNTGLAWDLPWGSTANGTQPGLWHRQSSWNQQFYFNNDDNTIRIGGKCLESAGNVYNWGTQVRLWECNGVDGQKWVMYGSEMKPKYTFDRGISFCLDTINGINTNGHSILWGCNGTSAQNWRVGDNDFTNSYQARIYAYPTELRGISKPEAGHVFVAIWQ